MERTQTQTVTTTTTTTTTTTAPRRPSRLCALGLGQPDRRTVRVGQYHQAHNIPEVVPRFAYVAREEAEASSLRKIECDAARAFAKRFFRFWTLALHPPQIVEAPLHPSNT